MQHTLIQFPDYTRSLVNVISAVLKHFDMCCAHPSLQEADSVLAGKRYNNVVLFLFDGMGCSVLKKHLDANAFLRKHFVCPICSVFPPTTTAATTAVETALTPLEHGRLGWTLYFPSIDKNVNIFPNTLKDSNIPAAPYHVANRNIPCEPAYRKNGAALHEADSSNVPQFFSVSKFGTNKVKNLKEMFNETFRLCTEAGAKYIYAYSEKPDNLMHISGTCGLPAKLCVRHINRSVQRFCRRLKQHPAGRNTLVLVTADHGHTPIRNVELTSFPMLEKTLVRRPSIEPRTVNFFVKPEYTKTFPHIFGTCFKTICFTDLCAAQNIGNTKPLFCGQSFSAPDADFILFSREDVFSSGLFGSGTAHPTVHTSVGDYIAVACSDIALVDSPKSNHFKSHHAGLTADEMLVPFIAVP